MFIDHISKTSLRRNSLSSVKGMAMIEILPIILVMFVLMGAALGSWGLAHTAILNSIAARHNSFFYFNNRTDLSYLRDFGNLGSAGGYSILSFVGVADMFYRDQRNRFAFITSEDAQDEKARATLRFVDFKNPAADCKGQSGCLRDSDHTGIHGLIKSKNTRELVSPAWIMVGYGICLNADCE